MVGRSGGLLHIGTSAFSEAGWRGRFYPEDLPVRDMLPFYAVHLNAVEVNSTFYRLPRAGLLAGWAGQVPSEFRFVIKASRSVTHRKPLQQEEPLGMLLGALGGLGDRSGPILFQLPPYLKVDAALLAAFLERFPPEIQPAFEFRHASWGQDDRVEELLRASGAARVGVETDDGVTPPVAGRGFIYLRLRRAEYTPDALAEWGRRLAAYAHTGLHVYAFVKHEESADSPLHAMHLRREAETQWAALPSPAIIDGARIVSEGPAGLR